MSKPPSKRVEPDGPADCRIAYLTESPGERELEAGLSLVSSTGRKLWLMAQAEGLPHRPIKDKAVLKAPAGDAWVGSVMPVRPYAELKGPIIDHMLKLWAPKLKLPFAEVYVLIGDLACRALLSQRLPPDYRSVMAHCASVNDASQAQGLVGIPNSRAKLIAMRHPSALLRGEDQWYPSSRLSLARARQCLDGSLPDAPPFLAHLFASEHDIPRLLDVVRAEGEVTFDLETERAESPRRISIGAFGAGEQIWVFSRDAVIKVAARLAELTQIRVIGQNIATFDIPVLARNGVPMFEGKLYDTRWADAAIRPRMPHDLAHQAAHWCEWAPPNWKPAGLIAMAVSAEGRRYCARDVYYTKHIEARQRPCLSDWSVKVREAALPVITACAIDGVRADIIARTRLRNELAEAYYSLSTETTTAMQLTWAKPKLIAWGIDLLALETEWTQLRAMSYKVKGAEARARTGLSIEVATLKRNEVGERVKALRSNVKRYEAIRPGQMALFKEYLFTAEDGLRLRATGKKTKSGQIKLGRKELDSLWRRSDVQAKLEKGDERVLILRSLAHAARLRASLGNHLGAKLVKGTNVVDLEADTQLRRGRLPVVYNPVQMRYSAGKGKGLDPEQLSGLAMQMHNVPSKIVVVVEGKQREWNLREQIIADDPATQLLYAYDWVALEQYIMAWQAGTRIGHWGWLKGLYDGVDTHIVTANVVLAGLPLRWRIAKGAWQDGPIPPLRWLEKGKPASPRSDARACYVEVGGIVKSARDIGKQANHAITLGGTERMLNDQYDIPLALGRAILAKFYETERGKAVKALHKHIEAEVCRDERVSTPFGESVDFRLFEARKGERKPGKPHRCYAVAQQGPAALMMQATLGDVDDAARASGGRLLLSTHDEFVVCAQRDPSEAIKKIMQQEWTQMPIPWGKGLGVPVSMGSGANWGACK